MAFTQFPDTLTIKTIDTAEEVDLGAFSSDEHLEIEHIRLQLFKHGLGDGTERFRLNIYGDSARNGLLYQTAWIGINDFSDGLYWLGWVRFDFDREHLNKNSTYYPSLEVDAYERNSSDYIGVVLDTYEEGGEGSNLLIPRIELYGYTATDE